MFWLSVERFENWLADQDCGFAFLGISEHKLKLASEMKPGDLILTYVSSGHSCFAGVREVISEKPNKSLSGPRYDEPFPYQIQTRPVVTLPQEKWIRIHDYIGKLSFLPANKDWRQLMRTALRKLDDRDGQTIVKHMKATAR